ncbi:MAG: putative Aldose 1-epimerase [Capsulimonas sp.]|nr:putative Aldose 1-epimerase [Capsulimonas sp.]
MAYQATGNDPSDLDITLTRGDITLTASNRGASLRTLTRRQADGTEWEVIWGYQGAANKQAGQGDLLIPYPGRVKNGQYTFDGQTYQLPNDGHDAPHAIHGFMRTLVWDYAARGDHGVVFRTRLNGADYADKGYPFTLDVEVAYELTDDGVICDFRIENAGDKSAPVAAGFHPYFKVGDGLIDTDILHVPMHSILEFENLIPTGNVLPVAGTPYDFTTPRAIGDVAINHCFIDPDRDGADGVVRISLHSAKRGVTVWMDKTFFSAVLYSGDPLPEGTRRHSLAIEPMTCGSDAFNHPEWGLVALDPGMSLTGSWGVTTQIL